MESADGISRLATNDHNIQTYKEVQSVSKSINGGKAAIPHVCIVRIPVEGANGCIVKGAKKKLKPDKYQQALDEGKDKEECVILSSSLAHKWDYDFTYRSPGRFENYTRGGVEYLRPYGWMRYGINVIGKFDGGDTTWIGEARGRHHSSPGEWIVTYHGTDCEAATKIADTDKSNHKRFQLKMGSKYFWGNGIYTTNSPKIAERYARKHSSDKAEYIYIYQIRLNPKRIVAYTDSNKNDTTHTKRKYIKNGVYYYITPNEIKEDIRIYGLLEKKR